MKNTLKILLVGLVFITATSVSAQKGKFAYIDSEELIMAMPERTKVENELRAEAQKLESQLQAMSQEYQGKMAEYQELAAAGGSQLILQTKASEIQDLELRIQKFQVSAQEAIQMKEGELMEILFTKAREAVSAVATEQGYTYVFDAAVLLHMPEGDNILPLVKQKMGISGTTTAPAPK